MPLKWKSLRLPPLVHTGVLALGFAWMPFFPAVAQSLSPTKSQNPINPQSPQTPTTPDKQTQKQGFMQQTYFTGNWGGERDQLDKEGVDFSVQYTNEVFGNPYGGNFAQGAVYDGLLNAAVSVNLEKLMGWEGASFHVNGFWTHGASGTQKYVGDFSVFSNIDAYDTVRLDELWLQQNFLNDRISLKLGQLTADSEFFSTQYGALFISSTFGAFPFIGQNFQPYSAPIFPLAATGVRLKIKTTDDIYLQAAAYYGDTGTEQANKHGTRFDYQSSTGVLTFYEIGYLLNQEKEPQGLAGTYKLGSFVHTANFETFASQAAFANGTGPLHGNGANYGVYGVIDQLVWQQEGSASSNPHSLGLFLRAGWAPAGTTEIDFDIDGGLNLTGLIPGRPSDVFGVGLARTAISHDFSNASVAGGGPAYRAEAIVEGTYSLSLAPWWQLQPDVQYIFSAGATTNSPDSLVVGLRSTISF